MRRFALRTGVRRLCHPVANPRTPGRSPAEAEQELAA